MSTFRVLIHGQNYWLKEDGEVCRMGFYATRIVEAEDADAAERKAAELVSAWESVRDPQNAPDDPPHIVADEVEEVAGARASDVSPGLVFYVEEDDS